MAMANEKSLVSLFGKEIVEISKELNQSGRFTDQQVETIEAVCKEILLRATNKDDQKTYIQTLNLKTSCLLCSWVLRGGAPLTKTKHT